MTAEQKGLEKYYPIFIKQHDLNMKLQMRIAMLQMDPSKAAEIFKPILDGSVDPHDKEKIVQNMVSFIKALSEYKELIEFTKKHAKDFRDFYQELIKSSESEYGKFLEMLERRTLDQVVDSLMKIIISHLKQRGVETSHLEQREEKQATAEDTDYIG
ncbi:MAG: hypothetical protein HY518_05240 [Candidatus Aenigmarchaeota archaeon]|nr:hypothetical protein [Candidatus Aenigmarchaeota archaeon]